MKHSAKHCVSDYILPKASSLKFLGILMTNLARVFVRTQCTVAKPGGDVYHNISRKCFMKSSYFVFRVLKCFLKLEVNTQRLNVLTNWAMYKLSNVPPDFCVSPLWKDVDWEDGLTYLIKRPDTVCQFKNLVTLSFPLDLSEPDLLYFDLIIRISWP